MRRFAFIMLLFLLSGTGAFSQKDRAKLEQDKKKVEAEIRLTNATFRPAYEKTCAGRTDL